MPTLQHTKKTSFKHNNAINTLMDQSNCGRCGGLMVNVQCLDIEDPSGQLWFDAKHCLQCGNIIDPLILKNQAIGQSELQEQARIPGARPSYAIAVHGKKRL